MATGLLLLPGVGDDPPGKGGRAMKVSVILGSVLAGALVGGTTTPTVTTLERGAPGSRSLRSSVEAALESGDLSTAFRTTEAAHRRASREDRWEAWIEVGDAYYRLADRTGAPGAASQRARDAYRAAFQSARRAESLDGVLRAAEAFARLGEPDEVEFSLRVARDLAGFDAEAVDDVHAAAERLSDLLEVTRAEEHDDD
jgi:hypothetical protein